MNKFMFKNSFYAIAVVLAAALPAAANSSSGSHSAAGHAPAYSSSHDGEHHGVSEEVHWGYSDEGRPERWGDINPAYELCKTGKMQSPINIAGATPSTSIGPIEIHYNDVPLDIVNNGHTIQINYPKGSYFVLDGEKFELLQFHFHSPSENLLEDRAFHMEAHLVHKNSKGELGVVGVFLKKGKANPLIETLWSHMPEAAGEHESPEGVVINVSGLLPANRSYYKFEGSLTTPPCSQEVNWNVFKTPVSVSAEQIQKFNKVIGYNARPAQPANRRPIVEITVEPPQVAAADIAPAIRPVNFDDLERESAEHGAESHESEHEEEGHAAAGGHGSEEDGHGGGGSHPAPLSYFLVWALTLALASMIGSYALMSRKWRFKVVFSNMRNMSKLKNMVGGASEAGQFKYRDEYFYAKVKPEGYVHLPHGVNHGHHGDDHGHGQDHGQDHGANDHHSPAVHAHEAHGPAADNHGKSPEARVDYDSKDSRIFAGGFVFLTVGVFLISYSPELFKHFDSATHGFVEGYHEPTGFGILSFIFRFGLAVAMTIYGILGMAKNTRSS